MEEEDLSRDKRMRDRDAIEAERREIRKRRMILGKFNEFAEKSEKRMGQEVCVFFRWVHISANVCSWEVVTLRRPA